MQRVEMMIGPREFAALTAEQFMQDVVSYYQVHDPANKLAGALTEGGFGSVPILSEDGKVVGLVSEFDLLQAIAEGKDLAQVTAGERPRPVSDNQGDASARDNSAPTEHHLIRVPFVDSQVRLWASSLVEISSSGI